MTKKAIFDTSTVQWLVHIEYRSNSGRQSDIVEGIGYTKEEAVAVAQEKRMLFPSSEVVRVFAKRDLSPWQPETPIYPEKELS